jgi:DNA-binding transcriptional ArsR family regulator
VSSDESVKTKAGADQPVKLTDPKAIRALAHPARLAVIEELYSGRELTATECAEIGGLSPSAMSYHLRSLEKVGIVERAPAKGYGRERPWRQAGAYLQVEGTSSVAESAALGSTVLARLADQFARWMSRRDSETIAWREASVVASGQVWLRVAELEELGELVDKLISSYQSRNSDDHPQDARRIRFSMFAFPADTGDSAVPTAATTPKH